MWRDFSHKRRSSADCLQDQKVKRVLLQKESETNETVISQLWRILDSDRLEGVD